MNRRSFAVLLLLAGGLWAQQVTPVQVPEGVRIKDALYADFNGDGRNDLLIATYGPANELRIHLQQEGARPFRNEADFTLAPVWKDVVAFAVGDVHPDPGLEVVLATSKGIWSWQPRAPEKERVRKIAECILLWQLPAWNGPFAWPLLLHDLDGDGRVDVTIPEPDGYRILLQKEIGVFAAAEELIVPSQPQGKSSVPMPSSRTRARKMRERVELQLSVGGGMAVDALRDTGAMVDVDDSVPAPQFFDWDADGDLDLIIRTQRWLFVWTLDRSGRYGAHPSFSQQVPVEEDRARALEVSYSVHVADLDLDRRADCVIFSGDRRSDDVRTQVQFFTQAGKKRIFGEKGLPDQLLVLAGFAGNPRFDDVNGDGYPDLMVGSLRPDLLKSLRGAAKGEVEVELYVYLNRKGTFPRRPDLVHRTSVQARGLRLSRQSSLARFFGDATGDGIRDLLLRDTERRLRVMMTRRNRGGYTIHSRPLWELRVDPRARVIVGPDRGKRKAPDLLVLESSQVLHVRFP